MFKFFITLNSYSIITLNIHVTVNSIIIFDLSPAVKIEKKSKNVKIKVLPFNIRYMKQFNELST